MTRTKNFRRFVIPQDTANEASARERRKKLQKDVDDYIAAGGEIQQIPFGVSNCALTPDAD